MTLYNPFRWHVVESQGKYYARAWAFPTGWKCLSRDGDCSWFGAEYYEPHCSCDSYELAQIAITKWRKREAVKAAKLGLLNPKVVTK